jgi:predicted transcriptional regulator
MPMSAVAVTGPPVDKADERVLGRMRRALGLRQVQVAEATGIERSKLSRWETGQVELNEDEIVAYRDYIDQVTLERSESGGMARDTSVGETSRERGAAFRQTRLSWSINQAEVAQWAECPVNLLSMWETGLIELNSDRIARLAEALASFISGKQSQLKWFENPVEIRRRRIELGISKRKLGKKLGRTESWVTDLEGGKIAVTPEISEPIWKLLATLEVEKGMEPRTAEISLSRPVTHCRPPLSLAKSIRLKRMTEETKRLEAVNLQLKKACELNQKIAQKEEEISRHRALIINDAADKVDELDELVERISLGEDRDRMRQVLAEMKEIFEG